MSGARLEIDLDKIAHNARRLVQLAAEHGISITGVTKAMLGMPAVANALVAAGVAALGDSRIENIETMRRAGVTADISLIRSPTSDEADRVVRSADVSFNTELDTIASLSFAARRQGLTHGVVLMVELGDLREGVMPEDVLEMVGRSLCFPNITLAGVGTNLACRSGVSPDEDNMGRLTALAEAIEARWGVSLETVSGGNSANLDWLLSGAEVGRVNNLRLGESILLGRESLRREKIDGLNTNATTLVAGVIESKRKPSTPRGQTEQPAFGRATPVRDQGLVWQSLVAIGHQDTDPAGLSPPRGVTIVGASSDHLVVQTERRLRVGSSMRLAPNYSALVRAATSPFVTKRIVTTERERRAPVEEVRSGRSSERLTDPIDRLLRQRCAAGPRRRLDRSNEVKSAYPGPLSGGALAKRR